MIVVTDILLWLHLLGLAMGLGGGIAMSRVGPKLIAGSAPEREQFWPLEKFLMRVMMTGIGILLVTGPLMLWLKFGDPAALGWPFVLKMLFVASTVVFTALSRWGGVRLEKGRANAGKLMSISGPLTGVSALLAMLFAVITFN